MASIAVVVMTFQTQADALASLNHLQLTPEAILHGAGVLAWITPKTKTSEAIRSTPRRHLPDASVR
jgi:hypothetical protein